MVTRLRVWFAFLLLTLNWGCSYLFIRIGIRQLSALDLVALRLLVGALTMGLIALLLRRDLRLAPRLILMIAIVATINTTIPFLLIAWGEETVDSGLTSVLNSTTPIFSVLIAGVYLQDERITPARLIGAAVGFAGVVLLLSRDLSHGGIHWSGVASQGAIVLAALCYAIGPVVVRRQLRGVGALTIATYALAIATAETVVPGLFFGLPHWSALRPETVLSIVWLGVLGSALGYLLFYFIIENWGASRTVLVTYTIPIVALSLGAVVLGERLDWRILAGSALVIVGVILVSLVRRSGGQSAVEEVAAPDAITAAEILDEEDGGPVLSRPQPYGEGE